MSGVDLEAELLQNIADGKVIVVAGAGLSASVTGGAAPGWRNLVQTGIEHLRSLGETDEWCSWVQNNLTQKFPEALLSAADAVDNKLRQCQEFAPWLRQQFEGLSITDELPLRALADWNCRVVTTNYDDLLSRSLKRDGISWKDSRNTLRFSRQDEPLVLHLHGHWNEPESVVLGIRSYVQVGIDVNTQAVLRSLALTSSLVLIGCSDDGLTDPNLGVFLAWLHDLEQAAGAEHRHYRLYCGQEPPPATFGRIFPVRYGETFEDLAGFLQKLVPHRLPVPPGPPAPTGPPPVSWPEAVHRYLCSLAEKTSRLSLLGFGKGLQVELPIERAWVPLRVLWTEIAGELRRDRALQEQGERLPVDVNAVFQTANGERWRGALLLGEPGAGKTTAARQLAWRLASGTVQPRELNLPAGICPVLLRFRDLSAAAAGADGGLKQFLTESLFRPLAPEGLQQPGTELWDSTNIPILWILDGLDEIVDHAARQRIAGWITQALHDRENDRFLVTCRFAGYNRAGISLGPGFREFHVQALNETDQQRFIYDWFTLVYERLGKNSQAADKAGRLLQKLNLSEYQTQKMRQLTGNPMLLTVLCLVFHDNEDLPKQRSEVYAHCVKVLLEHWRKELYAAGAGSVPRQPLDAETVEEVLQQLAWWLHSEDQRTSASLDQLAAQTEQVLGGLQPGVRQNLTSLQFLDRVREETGILAGEANGELSFLHLTFQEYLASKFAVANGQGGQLAVSASAAASDWWKETTLLSLRSTRPFCSSFFRSLLQQPGLEQRPDLLEQCLNEAKFVDAEPFVEIVQQALQQPQRAATVLTMLQNRGGQLPALADAAAELLEAGLHGVQPATVARQLRQAACELLLRADRKLPGHLQSQASSYDDRIQISFVQIPAGVFQMGRKGYTAGNAPEHPVRITRAFLLATTPVTNAQYELFLQANAGFRKPALWDDRRFNQPQQPVVGVSWDDAVAYCSWAGGRLPTEAEWEYACRAGSSGDFCFGDQQEQLPEYAWFRDNSGGTTQPVGLKLPNAWGLQDVHGNVWEWCADWYAEDWYSKSPADDPEGPRQGKSRVLRGGSWYDYSGDCSAWFRSFFTPGLRDLGIGFRLARTLPPDP